VHALGVEHARGQPAAPDDRRAHACVARRSGPSRQGTQARTGQPGRDHVWQSALDLELRHRPPAEIDVARFELWAQQLMVDAASKDRAGIMGDVATLEWIRDRFAHTLDGTTRAELDARLEALRAAADTGNLAAAADHAARLARPPDVD
jgi:hypothetical protein